MSTPPTVVSTTSASLAAGASRRMGRNARASTRHMLLGDKPSTPEITPAPPIREDDDNEPLMKRLARREAEKKVEELASAGDDDATSYFAALKRINEERPLLEKMAYSRPATADRAAAFPEGSDPPIRRGPSLQTSSSAHGKESLSRGQKRPRKPWRSMSRRERIFHVLVRVVAVGNVIAIAYFGYLAFGLFRSDKQMDPTAWRLAFGITAVMIGFQLLQMYFDYIRLFNIWLILTLLLLVGLFYGAVRFFLYVYHRDFPCYRGFTLGGEEFSMCREGRLLIALTSATVYQLVIAFFTWRWKRFRKETKQRTGEMEQDLDMTVILSGVDDLQREARGVTRPVIAPPKETAWQYGTLALEDPPEEDEGRPTAIYDNPLAATPPLPSQSKRQQSMGHASPLTGPQGTLLSGGTPSTVAATPVHSTPGAEPRRSLIHQAAAPVADSPDRPGAKIALPYQAPTPPVKQMRLGHN